MAVKWETATGTGLVLKDGRRIVGGLFSIKPRVYNNQSRYTAWRMDLPKGTYFKTLKEAKTFVEDLNWYGRVGDRM